MMMRVGGTKRFHPMSCCHANHPAANVFFKWVQVVQLFNDMLVIMIKHTLLAVLIMIN